MLQSVEDAEGEWPEVRCDVCEGSRQLAPASGGAQRRDLPEAQRQPTDRTARHKCKEKSLVVIVNKCVETEPCEIYKYVTTFHMIRSTFLLFTNQNKINWKWYYSLLYHLSIYKANIMCLCNWSNNLVKTTNLRK